MDIEIKYLADAPQYIPTLAQWFYEEWSQYDPTLTIERSIESLNQRLNTDKIPLVMLAVKDDVLIGVVSLKESIRIVGYEDRDLWLGNFVVLDEYREQGIGDMLLKHAYDKAQQLGYKKISLFTNVPGRADFWTNKGWKQFATDTYQGKTAILFEYDI